MSAKPGSTRQEGPTVASARRDLPPTAIERLLASGRRLPPRERRRLEGLAARRRAAAEAGARV